jgi:NAD(P)-dependent dehydrogenase (short-subunit alcohol dehydrogenase family)
MVTRLRERAQQRTGSPDNWEELLKPMPFGRAATPEEIGAAVAFLASEHSNYTSGSLVTIDAGQSARVAAF